MTFSVSIIIPVFNAEKYLRQAVESALQFECVKEVILVEDKSPDDALKLCKVLTAEDHRVKLYQHPNGENRGAGASRNLGIEMATSPYIAFLDADDWYAPNRFIVEKSVLQDSTIDGVYGATGFYYEEVKDFDHTKLTTFAKQVQPAEVLHEFLKPNDNNFTTNAITVKKALFLKSGVFDTSLKLHQDTHMWIKLLFFGSFHSGTISEAVAYRRVHPHNRIANKDRHSLHSFNTAALDFFEKQKKVKRAICWIVLKNYVITSTESNSQLYRAFNLLKIALRYPSLFSRLILNR